jgi:PAS domain S-box-containing protein
MKAARMVKVVDVNRMTVNLFEADGKEELLGSLEKHILPEAVPGFCDELLAIAGGRTFFEGEIPDQTLKGKPLRLWRTIVFSTENSKFNNVLVALTDMTERRMAEERLRESEARLLTVLESSPIPITLNSMDEGIVLYGNSALADFIGVPLPEIIGQKAANFYVNLEDRSRAIEEIKRAGAIHDFEVRLRRPDGTVVWVSLSTERTVIDGQTCLLSTFYDITGRKQAEALQTAVYQISEAANKSSSLEELFGEVHSIIGQVMPAQNFYIALYDAENDLISFPYYVDEVDGSAAIPPARPGRGMTEYILRTGKPLLSDSSNFEELAHRGEVELVGPPSLIWVGAPLVVEGRNLGVIALQDYHNLNAYTERELRMLEYVSGQVAKAIERTRLYADIRQTNRILSALQEATLPLIKQTELSEVLQEILRQVSGLFDTTDGYIYLTKPDDSDELVLSMGVGPSLQFIGTRLKKGEGMAGMVWQKGEPLNVEDYAAWSGRSAQFVDAEFHAAAAVPLIAKSKIMGVLGVGYMEPDRRFNPSDLELLARFAELASIAIENSRLYTLSQQELAERKMTEEALRETEAKYRAVVEHSPAITYTASMDESKRRLFVSPQIETLLGYTQAEYLEDSDLWRRILHPEDRDRVLDESRRFYETGVPFISEYRSVARDGRTLWFHDEAVIFEDESTGRRFIQGIKVDITQRMQTEALQAAIYRISDAASTSSSIEDLYAAIHRALQGVMIADNFFIALYDKAADLLSFPYYVDEYDLAPEPEPLGHGLTDYVIRNGIPLLGRPDTIQRLEDEGEVVSSGTRSIDWLGVPLKIGNEPFGAMVVQTYAEGIRYGQRDLDILNFVSTQAALSIERKKAEEALKASEERFRNLYQNNPVMLFTLGLDGTILAVNGTTVAQLEYPKEELIGTSVLEVVHSDDRAVMRETLARFLEQRKQTAPWEFRKVTKSGKILWVSETSQIVQDRRGGQAVLIVCEDITERKHRENELEALASVGAALRTAGSRADIISTVLDQSLALLDGQGAAMILRQAGTDSLITEAARGEWAEAEGVRVPPEKSASRLVMSSGKPYATNNVEDDSLIYRKDLLKGTRSFVSVPMSTPNGTLGTMNLGRQSEFSNEDIRLLTSIADMAANAIQRASAYEQIQRQIERLKALRTIDMFIASGADLHLTLQTILNQAFSQLEIDAADILLLNSTMHTLDLAEGIGFRSRGPEQVFVRVGEGLAGRVVLEREPVVVRDITALQDVFPRLPLLLSEGFVCYFGVPLIAKGEVKGVMEIHLRTDREVNAEWMDFLESLAGQAALAIDNASLFESLQRSNLELGMAYETTLEGWSAALDLRDKETEGHTRRVTDLTLKLAEFMGLGEKERVHIRRGALLHDIGKMGIPDRILLKPDTLTGEEWEIMRQHPSYAYKLLSPITHLGPALDIPYCHHERWDGSGYPRGLKGEAIPLAARIFAVADVYDALCSDRPYRPAWTREKALEHIKSLSGVHFDPKVVEAFLQVVGGN